MSNQLGMYSDSKNWFTKGQILLESQIIAQRTKLNPWESVTTKVDITSFVVPNNRTTVFVIKLISILQSSRISESVFLQALKLSNMTDPMGLNLQYHMNTSQSTYSMPRHHPPLQQTCPPPLQQISQFSFKMTAPVDRWLCKLMSAPLASKCLLFHCFQPPRAPPCTPSQAVCNHQHPLAQRVTSGAVNTGPKLLRLWNLNVTLCGIMTMLMRRKPKSSVKTRRAILLRVCGTWWSRRPDPEHFYT
jgi:hypothetical protein